MNLKYTDGNDPEFISLCDALDHSLNVAMGGFENRKKFVPFNQAKTMDLVVILYKDSTPIACGAIRRYDQNTAEIKRMFVKEEYRGQHFGKTILEELIHNAKERGYQSLLLETGNFLARAVALYKSTGFVVIPNYPPYENMEESVCMKLNL